MAKQLQEKKQTERSSVWYEDFKEKVNRIGLSPKISPITDLMDALDEKEESSIGKEEMEQVKSQIENLVLTKDEQLMVRGQFGNESVNFNRESYPGEYSLTFIQRKLQRRYKHLEKRMSRSAGSELCSLLFLARKEKGLTLAEVAQLTGISESYINRIEKGERKTPTFPVLQKLASVYGLRYEDVISLAVTQKSPETPKTVVSFEQYFLQQPIIYQGNELTLKKKQEIVKVIQFLEGLTNEELEDRVLKHNVTKRMNRLIQSYQKAKDEEA